MNHAWIHVAIQVFAQRFQRAIGHLNPTWWLRLGATIVLFRLLPPIHLEFVVHLSLVVVLLDRVQDLIADR